MKKWAQIKNGYVNLFVEQQNEPTLFNENGEFWIDVTELLDEIGGPIGPGHKYSSNDTFLPPNPPVIIKTRLDVINQLSVDYASIVNSSKTDVDVEIWLEKFRLQETFSVGDVKFIEAINFLVTKNLITQQKADEILS